MAFNTGTSHGLEAYLFRHGLNRQANFKKPVELRQGVKRSSYFEMLHDFHGDAGDSLDQPLTVKDVSSAGTPTTDFVTDLPDGVFQVKHDATSEAQEIGLTYGDHLPINLSSKPVIEMRVKVIGTGTNALGSADQRVVFGVGSDYNATLDSVVTNAWFRIDGANGDILVETDDGTTDTDDQDTGSNITDDEWMVLRIDLSDLSDVKFYVNGVRQLPGTTLDLSAVSANTKVQPILVMQRDAGTEAEEFQVDYIHLVQQRS